jgi:hypothetical protein
LTKLDDDGLLVGLFEATQAFLIELELLRPTLLALLESSLFALDLPRPFKKSKTVSLSLCLVLSTVPRHRRKVICGRRKQIGFPS